MWTVSDGSGAEEERMNGIVVESNFKLQLSLCNKPVKKDIFSNTDFTLMYTHYLFWNEIIPE